MTEKVNETATAKLNRWTEKFLFWILSAVLTIGGTVYNKMDTRILTLEEKVNYLNQDKVSRQELKEEMSLLRAQIERGSRDAVEQQAAMKKEIIERLDLIMRLYPPTNRQ